MSDFARHPAFEIARRIELRGEGSFSWLAILGDDQDATSLLEVANELHLVADNETRIINAFPFGFEDLRQKLKEPDNDIAVVKGLDQVSNADWAVLDVNRSSLERPGALIFWLSIESIARLNSQAPNIRSFIGGSIFMLSENGRIMTEEERAQRLHALESEYKLSEGDVLYLATQGRLPTEPDFAEWLVLLGRGDLL